MTALPLQSVPFPEEDALERSKLGCYSKRQASSSSSSSSSANNLPNTTSTNIELEFLPDQVEVLLDADAVREFMCRELVTPTITELYPRMWIVAKRSYNNIDALHRQVVKGREITISEDPNLHLTWSAQRIYVKPLPVCLLNYQVWSCFLSQSQCKISTSTNTSKLHKPDCDPRREAIGFMRSYALLIVHHSDFVIAHERGLIPTDITWLQWQTFIRHFRHLPNDEVSFRYHYGQLRLSHLHWAVRIFRPSSRKSMWFYELPYWSTTTYARHILAPLVFVFASVSVLLSAMQVMLSTDGENGLGDTISYNSQNALYVYWLIAVMFSLAMAAMLGLLIVIPVFVWTWQLTWGFQHRHRQQI